VNNIAVFLQLFCGPETLMPSKNLPCPNLTFPKYLTYRINK
jgi:hypothetical protein